MRDAHGNTIIAQGEELFYECENEHEVVAYLFWANAHAEECGFSPNERIEMGLLDEDGTTAACWMSRRAGAPAGPLARDCWLRCLWAVDCRQRTTGRFLLKRRAFERLALYYLDKT